MNSTKTPAALKREKRDAEIRRLRHDEPNLSLRAIAAHVGCKSPRTVQKVLDAEAAQRPKPEVAQVKITGGGVEVTEIVPIKITGGGVKVTKSTAVIITKPPRVTESTLKLVPADAEETDRPDVFDDLSGASLPVLATMANRYHAEAEEGLGTAQAAFNSALVSAWFAGNALIEVKSRCNHGEWLPWLNQNFEGDERTAQRYMQIASNTTRESDLDPEQSIRQYMATSFDGPETDKPESKTSSKGGSGGAGSARRDSVGIFADELVAVVERGQQLLVKLPTARWVEIEEAMEWPMDELRNIYKSVAKVAANNTKEQEQEK